MRMLSRRWRRECDGVRLEVVSRREVRRVISCVAKQRVGQYEQWKWDSRNAVHRPLLMGSKDNTVAAHDFA